MECKEFLKKVVKHFGWARTYKIVERADFENGVADYELIPFFEKITWTPVYGFSNWEKEEEKCKDFLFIHLAAGKEIDIYLNLEQFNALKDEIVALLGADKKWEIEARETKISRDFFCYNGLFLNAYDENEKWVKCGCFYLRDKEMIERKKAKEARAREYERKLAEKKAKEAPLMAEFETIWYGYPALQKFCDKKKTFKIYLKVRNTADFETIARGIKNYIDYCEAERRKNYHIVIKPLNAILSEKLYLEYQAECA